MSTKHEQSQAQREGAITQGCAYPTEKIQLASKSMPQPSARHPGRLNCRKILPASSPIDAATLAILKCIYMLQASRSMPQPSARHPGPHGSRSMPQLSARHPRNTKLRKNDASFQVHASAIHLPITTDQTTWGASVKNQSWATSHQPSATSHTSSERQATKCLKVTSLNHRPASVKRPNA